MKTRAEYEITTDEAPAASDIAVLERGLSDHTRPFYERHGYERLVAWSRPG